MTYDIDITKDKIMNAIKEGYSNISYFTHENFILRILLISPEGMPLFDFIPEVNSSDHNEISNLVRDADADQLAAFISSIFSQSYNLSLKTTQLKVDRHDLVTQQGVTIALYGVFPKDSEKNAYLGIWIDPSKGDELIFRKGAIKLVDNLKFVL
jgi:hypothetical protein